MAAMNNYMTNLCPACSEKGIDSKLTQHIDKDWYRCNNCDQDWTSLNLFFMANIDWSARSAHGTINED